MPLGTHATTIRAGGGIYVVGDWLGSDSENSNGIHTTGVYAGSAGLIKAYAYLFAALFTGLKTSASISNIDHDTGTDYPDAAPWTDLAIKVPGETGYQIWLWGKRIVDPSLEPPDSYRLTWDAYGSHSGNAKYAVSIVNSDQQDSVNTNNVGNTTDIVSPSVTASSQALMFSFVQGAGATDSFTGPASMEILRIAELTSDYGVAYERVPEGSTGTRTWVQDPAEDGVAISVLVGEV